MDTCPRLILVEGVPFTGKSTLSEFLATQLNRNGIAADWVPEGIMLQRYFPHVMAALDQKQPVAEDLIWEDWTAFVQTMTSAQTTFVVDSALSYAAVYPLLAEDCSTASILAFLQRIARACAPLWPRVIHLTGDVERLVPASITQRGQGWQEHLVGQAEAAPYQQARGRTGVEGATLLLADEQSLMQSVLEDGGWQALTLDITAGDWRASERAILDFLEMEEIEIERPTRTRSELEAFTGTYTAEDPERSGGPLWVVLEPETLALYGPNMRYGTLVAVSAARFHVQATPLDIEFTTEEEVAPCLRLFTSDGAQHLFRRT